MCGKLSSVPKYPEKFILPNGKKALINELRTLSKKKFKTKERRKEIKHLLSLPIVNIAEQKEVVLPGNGFKLSFDDNSGGLFGVLDGAVQIKEHDLPDNNIIVLTTDKFGKAILGKKEKEELSLFGRKCKIVEIVMPSKSKWIFKFPQYLM